MFELNIDKNNQEEFKNWSVQNLNTLFPFMGNLYVDGEMCYSNIEFLKKFENKKILVLGGGPSTNDVDWENLDYDYIVSLNHCFKNIKLHNDKVVLLSVGAEVDLQSDSFVEYVSEFNPYLFFEIHSRWFEEKEYFKELYENYKKIGCFHTRFYGKLGGGNRLLLFILKLNPKVVYFAGLDGPVPMIEKNHAFEGKKNTLPHGVNVNDAVDVFMKQYELFWKYIMSFNFKSKLYNLGEGLDYNMSSKFSEKYFPLDSKIKKKINRR